MNFDCVDTDRLLVMFKGIHVRVPVNSLVFQCVVYGTDTGMMGCIYDNTFYTVYYLLSNENSN